MSNKETIEQAAERLFPNAEQIGGETYIAYKGFIEGAKFQAERSYSEEEIKSAFKIGFNIGYGSPVQELDLKNEHCERWFKQFKQQDNQ